MQNYHRHSHRSNIFIRDSAANNEAYAKRAVELGHKIISSVEHGWQGYYFETYELAKKYNLKFVFGTEAYWVLDRKEKDRTNHHIVILSKNENGRQAINDILSEANISGYYYRPRVDLELLSSLPPNDVFVTSACIAFQTRKPLENSKGEIEYVIDEEKSEDVIKTLHNHFGKNFMLEIQYHHTNEQRAWNKFLLEMSEKYDIELIVGLDSHFIYPEDEEERTYVLDEKQKASYGDEEGWFMDYPSDDIIMDRFLEQGVFNREQVQRAMDNSDICLTFDDYDDISIFNKEVKLPTLYPDKTQEEKNKIYSKLISTKFKEYMKNIPKERYSEYFEGVKKEIETYQDTGMVDYPLLDYEIVKEAVKNGGLITNSGRGSAVGYFTNTLCGFSKVDRFTSAIKLYPERFISKTRILETKSLPDIDMNVGTVDIFEKAQVTVLGEDHVAPMIAFGTFKKRSAFKLYARTQKLDFELANTISEQIGKYEEALKYAEDDERDEIDLYDYVDEQYRTYIEKSEPYLGIVSDKKKAPSAYLLYQGNIRKEIGLIKCKSDTTKKEYVTCVIDGAIAENYKFLKNDILKVDVVLLIDKIFRRIGMDNFDVNRLLELIKDDCKVWDLYANGFTIGLNQCEKESTTKKCMKYKPKNVSELAAFIAGIRPGFKSMYLKFESREDFSYGIPALDNLLQTEQFPFSFPIYQEQIMNILNYGGFPLDECYGIIKAIAKKHPEKVRPLKSRFINGFKKRMIEDEHLQTNEAQEVSEKVWQIINDNCGYGFNSAHAFCMSLDSLYCAWQKANYPYEFYEVMLQHFSEKGKKDKVTLIKQEMLKAFGISEGAYKFRTDNRAFLADKKHKCIIPSLVSIKGLSQACADDLYSIKDEKFDNFIDVLYRLKETSVKSNQLDILIKLDYFSEFGDINKLLKITELFETLHDKSQFKKDKLSEFNLSEELVRKHSASETETRVDEIDCERYLNNHGIIEDPDCMKYKYIKDEFGKTKEKIPNGYSTKKTIKKYQISEDEQKEYASKVVIGRFSEINMRDLLSDIFKSLKVDKCPVVDKLKYQKEHLGYINIKLRVPESYYYITNIDGKYSNKVLTLYQLKTGATINMKVKGKTLEQYPLNEGDMINILESKDEQKWGRKDGEYYRKDEYETILKKYNYVR